jgi:hypothetical protein
MRGELVKPGEKTSVPLELEAIPGLVAHWLSTSEQGKTDGNDPSGE